MTEVIEGTAVAIPPEPEVRTLVVAQQPGQVLVTASDRATGPADMVGAASNLATVLKDIVERQKLYAVIQGKKYPQVEAWMTIARLDNVVAREPQPPIRHDDGSYEAFAELIRLSDGMVIGSSSALCGTPDDKPWGTRAEPARRSMAQTRATSRAFRQQYSWIMALAGYEPTPAEEMPTDSPTQRGSSSPAAATPSPAAGPLPVAGEPMPSEGVWRGAAGRGKPPVDGSIRTEKDGREVFGFTLTEPVSGARPFQVIADGPLAAALNAVATDLLDRENAEATVWGVMEMVPWQKKQPDDSMRDMPPYRRVTATRVATPDFTVPAPSADKPLDLDDLAW